MDVERVVGHLVRTAQQIDYMDHDEKALVTVAEVSTSSPGIARWVLVPYQVPLVEPRTASVEVRVWDHSTGGRISQGGDAAGVPFGVKLLQPDVPQVSTGPGLIFSFHPAVGDDVRALRAGQHLWLSAAGRPVVVDGSGQLRMGADLLTGAMFWIELLDHQPTLRAGGRFRLHSVDHRDQTVVNQRGFLHLAPTEAASETAIFTFDDIEELRLHWNPAHTDNAIFAGAPLAGYRFVRTEGRVFVRPRPGTVALKEFHSTHVNDTMTTATEVGQEAALNAYYQYRGIVGWAYATTRPETVAARQYWMRSRSDNMLTATPEGEGSCAAYTFLYEDCFVLPPAEPQHPAGRHLATATQINPAAMQAVRQALHDASGHPLPQVETLGSPAVVHTQHPTRPRRPVRALVLGGGGAKGAFEAGAVNALVESGYRPDIVCGVSVGALNGLMVALQHSDGRPRTDDLVRLWRQLSSTPGSVYLDNFYIKLLNKAAEAMTGVAKDSATWAAVTQLLGTILLPGAGLAADSAGIGAGVLATQTEDLSAQMRRLINLATMTHSVYSMAPLRLLIEREVANGRFSPNVQLRVGMTDMKSGCFLTVSEPSWDVQELAHHGRVEFEPDGAEGGNWLNQPIFNSKCYAMHLSQAIYGSLTMPAFMEPSQINLNHTKVVHTPDGLIAKLNVSLAPGVQELVDAAAPGGHLHPGRDPLNFPGVQAAIDDYAAHHGMPGDAAGLSAALRRQSRLALDGTRGYEATKRTLFDGGLIDAIPIRTALRMGATEITVIGVDNLHSGGQNLHGSMPIGHYFWLQGLLNGSSIFGGVDPFSLPLVQYVFATIQGLVHGTERSDMLSALGNLDARRIAAAALAQMNADQAGHYRQTVWTDANTVAPARRTQLGGTTGLGGRTPAAYGELDETNAVVNVILPDRELLDARAFEDAPGVEEALELGRLAAMSPVAV